MFHYRSPEFFYPKKFVTIKSAETRLDTSTIYSAVSTIYHGTHLDEVKGICVASHTATFVGREKRWRPGVVYNEDEQTYGSQFCSYIIENIDDHPEPMTKDNQRSFGPFLWFGMSKEEVDDYGPYCFEFNFETVLRKYLQSRGKDKTLCYRAGGTLVYKQEVTHIVIICCEDDNEYQSYPLIDATSTKYFKPSIRSKLDSTEPPVHKKQKMEQGSSSEDTSTQSPSIPATALRSTNLMAMGDRHEHVALAFYLPHDTKFQLTNQEGKLNRANHNNRCLKSKGKFKMCQFPEFDTQYIELFNNDPTDHD